MATIRQATARDLPGITQVRTSVRENHLSVEQLAARGITEASVAASFLADSKGWVAEHEGAIVAFSIADRATGSIFALFVLPDHAGAGLGRSLLTLAVAWLRENGIGTIWLTTGRGTSAADFYRHMGWTETTPTADGQHRFELTDA